MSKQSEAIIEAMNQIRDYGGTVKEVRMASSTWEDLKRELPDVFILNAIVKLDETVTKGSVYLLSEELPA